MALGADGTVCTDGLVAAMRARLEEIGMGDNVDLPDVKKNFDALGTGLHQVLTVRAETASDPVADADFWAWVQAVNAWMAAVAAWQTGLAAAFNSWAPTQPAEQAFRSAVIGLQSPGAPPPTPPQLLRGRIV